MSGRLSRTGSTIFGKEGLLWFPPENFYIDESFISLYQEFQMMVVMSWSDMASRLVFAFDVLLGMDSIKELLTDASEVIPSKEPKPIREVAVIAPERLDEVESRTPYELRRDLEIFGD